MIPPVLSMQLDEQLNIHPLVSIAGAIPAMVPASVATTIPVTASRSEGVTTVYRVRPR